MKHWKRILSAMMVGSVALLGAACAEGDDAGTTGTDTVEQDDGTTGDTGDDLTDDGGDDLTDDGGDTEG